MAKRDLRVQQARQALQVCKGLRGRWVPPVQQERLVRKGLPEQRDLQGSKDQRDPQGLRGLRGLPGPRGHKAMTVQMARASPFSVPMPPLRHCRRRSPPGTPGMPT